MAATSGAGGLGRPGGGDPASGRTDGEAPTVVDCTAAAAAAAVAEAEAAAAAAVVARAMADHWDQGVAGPEVPDPAGPAGLEADPAGLKADPAGVDDSSDRPKVLTASFKYFAFNLIFTQEQAMIVRVADGLCSLSRLSRARHRFQRLPCVRADEFDSLRAGGRIL